MGLSDKPKLDLACDGGGGLVSSASGGGGGGYGQAGEGTVLWDTFPKPGISKVKRRRESYKGVFIGTGLRKMAGTRVQ